MFSVSRLSFQQIIYRHFEINLYFIVMLRELSIRDVVLIDALDLEIGQGFTALTGETGAGKSILLDALGMALGDRADKGLVRNGTQKAIATATFEIGAINGAHNILETSEIDFDDGLVVLRRIINADGKSRAFINDIPVSNNILRQVAEQLLEVHGQHSAIGLMDEKQHLAMLDTYLSNEKGEVFTKALSLTQNLWAALQNAKSNLDEARAAMGKSGAERDYLAHVLTELEKLSPQKGEEAELDIERRFLMASERVTSALKEAVDALENGKVENHMGNAARALSKIGTIEGESGKKISGIIDLAANALEKAQNEIAESLGHLNQAGYSIDLDPQQLEKIEERLFALRAAARKHGVNVDDLQNVLEITRNKLNLIDNSEEELLKAEAKFKLANQEFEKSAQELSQIRQSGALQFDAEIMVELPPLKLEKMRFKTCFETASPNGKGWDKVIFQIAPNPGAGFGPLSAIASGGELSRLSLALKVVLASGLGALALVFDEVDQGIGGATADAVGKRLSILAKKSQVLCVTHSPQVAARANHHWRIEKSVIDGVTKTKITPLSAQEREEELARMLAGETITEEARAAARALTKNAMADA